MTTKPLSVGLCECLSGPKRWRKRLRVVLQGPSNNEEAAASVCLT